MTSFVRFFMRSLLNSAPKLCRKDFKVTGTSLWHWADPLVSTLSTSEFRYSSLSFQSYADDRSRNSNMATSSCATDLECLRMRSRGKDCEFIIDTTEFAWYA